MKYLFSIINFFTLFTGSTQIADRVFKDNIASVKLSMVGDPYGYPILFLGKTGQLELRFDDLDGGIKNYYYSIVQCNADWNLANVQFYDYSRGFISNRITNYTNSSIVSTRYTHYTATLPDRMGMPYKSGNYLVKVFLDNDTAKLCFTSRFIVVDDKMPLTVEIKQPMGGNSFLTKQRIQVSFNTSLARIQTFSPQELKVVIVQNHIWPAAILTNRPTIFRGNYYEYSDDNTSFEAGREWRWFDFRSTRLMGDRMTDMQFIDNQIYVKVKPDVDRKSMAYIFYRDYNGGYSFQNINGFNPYWQGAYAHVLFTYVPPANRKIAGKEVYIFGGFSQYAFDSKYHMVFNEETGVYECNLFLKEGFYNYEYVTVDANNDKLISLNDTEGNVANTENTYTVLVYYRPFGARADELIGYKEVNSATNLLR